MQGFHINKQRHFQISDGSLYLSHDNFQRLSYYLASISSCFPGVIDPSLIAYQNYLFFTPQTREAIIRVANIFKPSLLEDKAIFRTAKPMMDLIKPGHSNAHLTLTEITSFTVLEIDSCYLKEFNLENIQITMKMVYTEEWINSYYYIPMRNLGYNNHGNYIALNTGSRLEEQNKAEHPIKELLIAFLLVVALSIFALFIIIPCYWKRFDGYWKIFIFCVFIPGFFVSSNVWTFVDTHIYHLNIQL